MKWTTITIGDRRWNLQLEKDIDTVKVAIMDAVESGCRFVDIPLDDSHRTCVLITPATNVTIESVTLPDDHGPDAEMAVDFDEYL